MLNSEKFAALLKTLGHPVGPQGPSCPLHNNPSGTLRYQDSALLPGGLFITCTHPRCGFQGGVMDLVARVKKCRPQDIAHMFMPGTELQIFFEGSGNQGADQAFVKSELDRLEIHHRAQDYLESCKSEFLNNYSCRQFLVARGVKEDLLSRLPCGSPVPNAPDRLVSCVPTKHTGNFILMPYVASGITVGVTVYDIRDASRRHHCLESQVPGIFLESLVTADADSLTVCCDELDAMVLMTKISDVGCKGLNPVAVSDSQALAQRPGLRSITLLGHAGKPASLSYVMQFLRLAGLQVFIVALPGELSTVSPTKLRKIFEGRLDAWKWLAAKVITTGQQEGIEGLSIQLVALGLDAKEKGLLITGLRELGASYMIVEAVKTARSACLVKNWGSLRVQRTFAGYEQLMPVTRKLSNFIMIVNYITGETENKIFSVTVKTSRPGCPGYDMAIPASELKTRDGLRLAHLVWNRLIELGVNFEPYAAGLSEADWLTMVRMFDGAEYKAQSRIMGIEGSYVRYPEMRVNLATGHAALCDRLPGLPAITEAYSRVRGDVQDHKLVKALHGQHDAALESLLGVLGHVLSETARSSRPGYVPTHLMIPYTTPETVSDAVLDQVTAMLGDSGVLEIPETGAQQRKFLESCKSLGSLPVICRARDSIMDFARKLNNARQSMVIMYPASGLRRLGKINRVYYMSEITLQDHLELAPEVLDMMRQRWASWLGETYRANLGAETPAIAWLETFCGSCSEYLFSTEPFNHTSCDDLQRFKANLVLLWNKELITLGKGRKLTAATDVGSRESQMVRISQGSLKRSMEAYGIKLNWELVFSQLVDSGLWSYTREQYMVSAAVWQDMTKDNCGFRLITSTDLSATA